MEASKSKYESLSANEHRILISYGSLLYTSNYESIDMVGIVHYLEPDTGGCDGGEVITVHGNFPNVQTDNVVISFGETCIFPLSADSQKIVFKSPGYSDGPELIDVAISLDDGDTYIEGNLCFKFLLNQGHLKYRLGSYFYRADDIFAAPDEMPLPTRAQIRTNIINDLFLRDLGLVVPEELQHFLLESDCEYKPFVCEFNRIIEKTYPDLLQYPSTATIVDKALVYLEKYEDLGSRIENVIQTKADQIVLLGDGSLMISNLESTKTNRSKMKMKIKSGIRSIGSGFRGSKGEKALKNTAASNGSYSSTDGGVLRVARVALHAAEFPANYMQQNLSRPWFFGSQFGDDLEKGFLRSFSKFIPWQRVRSVAVGENHVCALTIDLSQGKVYTWGDNTHGQLGSDHHQFTTVPTLVPLAGEVSHIACSSFGTLCTMKRKNAPVKLLAWGKFPENVTFPFQGGQSKPPTAVLSFDTSDSNWKFTKSFRHAIANEAKAATTQGASGGGSLASVSMRLTDSIDILVKLLKQYNVELLASIHPDLNREMVEGDEAGRELNGIMYYLNKQKNDLEDRLEDLGRQVTIVTQEKLELELFVKQLIWQTEYDEHHPTVLNVIERVSRINDIITTKETQTSEVYDELYRIGETIAFFSRSEDFLKLVASNKTKPKSTVRTNPWSVIERKQEVDRCTITNAARAVRRREAENIDTLKSSNYAPHFQLFDVNHSMGIRQLSQQLVERLSRISASLSDMEALDETHDLLIQAVQSYAAIRKFNVEYETFHCQ